VKNSGLMIVFVIVIGILIGFMYHFKQEAQNISKSLESERYSRLVAEEKVVNNASKIKQLENDLKSSEEKIAKVQTVLKDQKSINTDLERQFDRLTKAKSDLENQLRNAIAQPPSAPVQTAMQETTQDIAVAQASQ
jgi:septal ring factor EnvC (AmiA/AmiB activator)